MLNDEELSQQIYSLAKELYPICRSITGNGVRETLAALQQHIPLSIIEVPTGTKAFDWVVPKEWNIKQAFIADENENIIVDFSNNNLHVVGYSVPVNQVMPLAELQKHLFSLPDQPDAIPYITSYYKENWGFCLTHTQRQTLKEGQYHIVIDSELKEGNLTFGELIIKGDSDKEVFLSTYVCHPSMANNELSGPCVSTFIAKWLLSSPRKYTYRIIFIPETIGSIVYLSKNLEAMKKNIIAGFNLSCIGDERAYSYVASRYGNTYADKVAENVLKFKDENFFKYSFLERGSDERQYCSAGVDLPLVALSRSKYSEYPEYHTSLDDFNLVTAKGLKGGYDMVEDCINIIENNAKPQINCLCEPQLGKRGLYPNFSTKATSCSVETMMDFIAYADGSNDLIDISNIIKKPVSDIIPIMHKLVEADLMRL
ncbi:MAG: DUF4910 domain-containing protein [Alphaproteobacteria bacterium]